MSDNEMFLAYVGLGTRKGGIGMHIDWDNVAFFFAGLVAVIAVASIAGAI